MALEGGWAEIRGCEDARDWSHESAEDVLRLEREEMLDDGMSEAVTLIEVTWSGGWSGTLSQGLRPPDSWTLGSLRGWRREGGGEVEQEEQESAPSKAGVEVPESPEVTGWGSGSLVRRSTILPALDPQPGLTTLAESASSAEGGSSMSSRIGESHRDTPPAPPTRSLVEGRSFSLREVEPRPPLLKGVTPDS